MTVAELIAELSKYPADMRVVVPGYEFGFDDAAPVTIWRAVLDDNADPADRAKKATPYDGRHTPADSPSDNPPAVEVLAIGPVRG